MRKTSRRLITFVLSCLMMLTLLAGCASLGEPVMKLGSTEITGNMIEFWLGRYKAQFVYYYGSGIKTQYNITSLDSFWSMKVEGTEGKTYDDLFTGYIIDNAKTYLCALYLFDQFGLKLSDSTVKSVDDTMTQLVADYAEGSKSEFNAVLAAYGVNYKILRELYLIDEKVDMLRDYLFGENGIEAITDEQKEEYYQEKYVRLTQLVIFVNECPETDANGNYVTDSDGYTKYRDMTADENAAARSKAEEALAKINAGSGFDTVLAEYDENHADDEYLSGIYMSADSAYGSDEDLQKVYETVLEMKVGEVKMVELTHGLHIIKRMELDAGAYNVAKNTDFFTFTDPDNSTKLLTYEQYLRTPMFLEYIGDHLTTYSSDVKIDNELLSKYRISAVGENYYF